MTATHSFRRDDPDPNNHRLIVQDNARVLVHTAQDPQEAF